MKFVWALRSALFVLWMVITVNVWIADVFRRRGFAMGVLSPGPGHL